MRTFCLTVFALLITGCAQVQTPLDEGYEFGDTTGSTLDWRDDYCAESDLRRRAVLLAFAARSGLALPHDGICTDPLELLDAGPDTQ